MGKGSFTYVSVHISVWNNLSPSCNIKQKITLFPVWIANVGHFSSLPHFCQSVYLIWIEFMPYSKTLKLEQKILIGIMK